MKKHRLFKWYDCFDKEVEEGDDVIIGIRSNNGVILHSGIITKIVEDETMHISYNNWVGDVETVRTKTIHSKKFSNGNPNTHVESIFKIF